MAGMLVNRTFNNTRCFQKKETEIKIQIPGELNDNEKLKINNDNHHILRHGVFFLITRN